MDTIRIKEEIPFEQEDEVENIRIKDELETGQEGEEEACNTIYIKVEEPCENEERDNYTQKAEISEDPLLLNDGPVTSNKESHSSISYREQETGEAYNASVHVHQHTLYIVDQEPSHSAIKQENKLLIKKCEFCEKRFTLECNLNDHINTHTEEEPYLCEVCQKYFKQDGFKKRTDNREKPFQCELCEKCFKEKTGLNYHMGTHTGEKPFQCKFCEKCFLGRTNLITHIGTHTGDKPFQCKFCEKCFSMKRNLKIHIRTHSGEKPFRCEFCEKCFRQKNGLNYHMGTHTGVKPFQCEFCSKCFMSKNALKKHNVSHWREAIPM